ncbi:MAG: hypothetical protein Q8L72_06120 [Moraxellaceae bacterium]|nr:hypothetical protein [Moraxellaceae bacterium]
MTYEGEWKEGQHISFFDQTQGGTKVIVEHVVPNEAIKMKHVAMVSPQNMEVPLTDEAFEEMMNAWPQALQLFKDLCEE